MSIKTISLEERFLRGYILYKENLKQLESLGMSLCIEKPMTFEQFKIINRKEEWEDTGC